MELDLGQTMLRLLTRTSSPSPASVPTTVSQSSGADKSVDSLNLRIGERVAVQVIAGETPSRSAGNHTANAAAGTGANTGAGTNAGQTLPTAHAGRAAPQAEVMLVEVRGQRVLAEIAPGIRPGDHFQARVVSVDGQPMLRRLSPDALNAAASVSGRYKQLTHLARPHTESVRGLARLATAGGADATPSPAASPVARSGTSGATEPPSNSGGVAARAGLPSLAGAPIATDTTSGITGKSSGTAPGIPASNTQHAERAPSARAPQPTSPEPMGRVRAADTVASGAALAQTANTSATAQSAAAGALDIGDIPGLARHLLSRLPDAAALTQPAFFRQALDDSGTAFEAKLAHALLQASSALSAFRTDARADTANAALTGNRPTSSNPQGIPNATGGVMLSTLEQLAKHDLKGTLLLVKTLLQRGLAETTAGAAPGSKPAATAAKASSERMPTHTAEALRGAATQWLDSGRAELARTVEGMQAEIERQQLAQHLAREEGQPRFLELALAPDPHLRRAEITIGEERKAANEDASGSETHITLRLDLGPSGPLLVGLLYRVQTDETSALNVTLTSPRSAFAERLQTALPTLVATLRDAGITVTQATARQGPVPATLRPQHLPEGLVNVRT